MKAIFVDNLMMMLGPQDLHLELTSKCTLKCPACPRTEYAGHYKVGELPLEMIQKILTGARKYKMVSLCGDHGDPIYHSRFHDILDHLKFLPGEPFIQLSTNGSYRDENWWTETGQRLRKKDQVIFGIDGLEDTNHIYRVNADWESLQKGIRSLRAATPARLVWQWILFRHNQHQLFEGSALARKLGFDRFIIVESSRYKNDESTRPTITLEQARRIASAS